MRMVVFVDGGDTVASAQLVIDPVSYRAFISSGFHPLLSL